ncbi:MAG TPA: helix-turn-helix domain-containing protein [Puia sp.]
MSQDDPVRTVDQADFYTVIERISASLDDKALGIRVGHHLNLNTLGAVYRISQKAVTVQEALYYCQAYLVKTLPIIRVSDFTHDEDTVIQYHIDNLHTHANRVILETILIVVAREMKVLCGEEAEVRLYSPYYDQAYPSGWKEGPQFMLRFNKLNLKAAQKNNSHWGLDVLIPEYLRVIEGLKTIDTFESKVKKEMLFMAKPELPSITSVAYSFNLTTRTLQRRLKEEGTSFRLITERLNCEICNLLIRHERYVISDIATLLGYADAASFIHTFKKWYGHTPQKFRTLLASTD